jgi:hypothetical protein
MGTLMMMKTAMAMRMRIRMMKRSKIYHDNLPKKKSYR